MGVHLFQMGGPHTTSPPLATALARIEVSAAEVDGCVIVLWPTARLVSNRGESCQ